MNVIVKRLGGNEAEVTITIPAADVDRAIGEAYSRLSSRVRIPGFRPGKAPRAIVDQRIGRDRILEDARESLTDDFYPLAVDQEDLRPIAPADFGEAPEVVEGSDYTFTLTVELRPSFEIEDTSPPKLELPSAKSTDSEVDAQLNFLRERYANLEPVERGIEDGDFVLLSFVGTVDGADYPENVVDKYLYETGRGLMPLEFDAALMGAKAGTKAHAEFPIPDTSSVPEIVGKTAHFDIEVHEVKAKVLPDIDDAFAGEVGGFETIAELREDLRRRMDESKATGHLREVERSARAALAARVTGDIPTAMLDYRSNAMTEEFFETLEQRQITLDDYIAATGVTIEQIHSDIADRAAEAIREELALEALFRALGMEVTPEEIDAEIAEMAGPETGAAERMRERFRSTGMMPLIREQIVHRRAVRWLMDNAEVTETGGDGTAGAEGPKKKPAAKKKAKADAE